MKWETIGEPQNKIIKSAKSVKIPKTLIFFFITGFISTTHLIPENQTEIQIKHNYVHPGENLKLIPDRTETKSILKFFNENSPDFSIEMLYSFPENPDSDSNNINWEKLYFKLRSISKLENVWYFSEHAGKYRYMFPRAYVIDSPESKQRLPDFNDNTKFENAEIFVFLDDAELKDGRYRVNYYIRPDSIQATIQNVTPLRRFIKVVEKENFYINFLFFTDNENKESPLKVYIYAAYSLKNKYIVLKLLKSPYSTLAKRVYTIFAALTGNFNNANLPLEFPDNLRE